jgi:phosphatidylglycerophosphate synthase
MISRMEPTIGSQGPSLGISQVLPASAVHQVTKFLYKFNHSPLVATSTTLATVGAVSLLVIAAVIKSVALFSAAFVTGSVLTYVIAVVVVVRNIESHHPFPSFGAANIVTMMRLALTCLLAGIACDLLFTDALWTGQIAWFFFGIAALALALDGLDGFLARWQGLSSDFGARFDMEVDAFQILCLAVIVALLNKAGWWVLLSGLLRYAFVAVGLFFPLLNRALFPSWRRKCAAVVQNSVLAILLMPLVVRPESSYIAAIALAVLVYSFAVDVVWLVWKNSQMRQSSK